LRFIGVFLIIVLALSGGCISTSIFAVIGSECVFSLNVRVESLSLVLLFHGVRRWWERKDFNSIHHWLFIWL